MGKSLSAERSVVGFAPVGPVQVHAYRIPTVEPEWDGTLEWSATTLVVVEIEAVDCPGLGYTYADAATARASMSTHFRYEQDGGNFSRTLLRCLGVGECRKKSGTPAVRGATEETLLIATGFSCREQIRQTTGRRTMHPAEVVELAFSA